MDTAKPAANTRIAILACEEDEKDGQPAGDQHQEHRNGKADQALFKLVKTGQIARKNIKEKRGSMYIVR